MGRNRPSSLAFRFDVLKSENIRVFGLIMKNGKKENSKIPSGYHRIFPLNKKDRQIGAQPAIQISRKLCHSESVLESIHHTVHTKIARRGIVQEVAIKIVFSAVGRKESFRLPT